MAHEQAAHLPWVVGQAGETAPGDHARARGRRRRRALDDHLQPGAVHPRPARRALPGGRFRRVRVRPGRLDHDGCVRVRRGIAAGQRGVRGGAVRRRARHPAHVHPPREWFEAAERPARADLRPLSLYAGALVAGLADLAGVVGREERPDHELAGLDRPDLAADLLDDPDVLVTHRDRPVGRFEPAVWPQVGPADTRRGQADDRVRRLDDPRFVTLFDPHVARRVHHSATHQFSPSVIDGAWPYCSSLTCSPHATTSPASSACWIAMWVMNRVSAAPCQWFSPGSKKTRSPGRMSSIGPPSRWQTPTPSVTQIVWPWGWVCQALRAPGMKCTQAAPTRESSDGAAMVSM